MNELLNDLNTLVREINQELVSLAQQEKVEPELIWIAEGQREVQDKLLDILMRYMG